MNGDMEMFFANQEREMAIQEREMAETEREFALAEREMALMETGASTRTGITVGADGRWIIRGKISDGGAGLKVEAWDRDLITKDDLLGTATTDANGNFSITYDGKSHKELFFDKKPDLYFKVYDADNQLINQTKPIKNADEDTKNIVFSLSG